jgi:hypothetical protein
VVNAAVVDDEYDIVGSLDAAAASSLVVSEIQVVP